MKEVYDPQQLAQALHGPAPIETAHGRIDLIMDVATAR